MGTNLVPIQTQSLYKFGGFVFEWVMLKPHLSRYELKVVTLEEQVPKDQHLRLIGRQIRFSSIRDETMNCPGFRGGYLV